MHSNHPSEPQEKRERDALIPVMDRIIERTARGIVFSAGARASLFIGSLVGGIFLARLLTPTDFGVYALVSFVVVKLNTLAQLGLSTVLVHDREDPTLRAKRSVFSLHAVNAIILFGVTWVASPGLATLFRLQGEAASFFHLVAIGLLLDPFASIPAAQLSRRLAYDRLALVDLLHMLVYQGTAVVLAFAGWSYWSFGYAAIASSLTRALALHVMSPWRLGFAFDKTYLKRSVRFGGSFQLAKLTSIIRDNIIIFLGGPLFGPTATGFLSWSHRLSEVCSQEFVAVCAGVSFPSLSRMRFEPRLFAATLTKMLRYVNLMTFLSLGVVAALLPEIVSVVYGDKWAPAVPLFYFFAFRMVSGNYTTLLDSALKAQGRPEKSLAILSAWTIWEWGFALIAVWLFGYTGIAVSHAIGGWLAVAWLYRELTKFAKIRFWHTGGAYAVAAAATVVLLLLIKGHSIDTLVSLLLMAVTGVVTYLVVLSLVDGLEWLRELKRDLVYLLTARGSEITAVAEEPR